MTPSEQIVACENRLLQALKTGDTKVLDELIHEDLIFNIPTGETITKAMDIHNYSSGILIVSEIQASDQVVKAIDDVYSVAVTLELKAKYAGQNIDGKYRYLRVWKFTENSWKVIAGSGFQIHR